MQDSEAAPDMTPEQKARVLALQKAIPEALAANLNKKVQQEQPAPAPEVPSDSSKASE